MNIECYQVPDDETSYGNTNFMCRREAGYDILYEVAVAEQSDDRGKADWRG